MAQVSDTDSATLSHDTIGPQLDASVWVLTTLAAILLGLRVYCKHLGRRGLWWDDWFLIASWFTLLACTILISIAVSFGYGGQVWDVTNFSGVIFILAMRTTVIMTGAAWSKTAFAITLLRLMEGRWRWLLWFIMITMNIALGLSALIGWVNCKPLAKAWDTSIKDGECWDLATVTIFSYVGSSYSAFCDLVLALLPWKVIWGLQMKTKEKLGVGIAMSLGLLACVMAIIKASKLNLLTTGTFYSSANLAIWDTAEVAVTIMAASIPVLRILVREVKSSANRYYKASGGTNGLSRTDNHRAVIKSELRETDDNSDKSILGASEKQYGKTGIFQTREIQVEYRKRSEGDIEEAFEMQSTARR